MSKLHFQQGIQQGNQQQFRSYQMFQKQYCSILILVAQFVTILLQPTRHKSYDTLYIAKNDTSKGCSIYNPYPNSCPNQYQHVLWDIMNIRPPNGGD